MQTRIARKAHIFLLVLLCATSIHGCFSGDTAQSAKALYESGLNALDEKKTQEAIAYFNKAIEKDAAHAMAHYQLGCLYIKLKRLERAKRELNLAIRYNPDLIKAKRCLARLYYQSGAYEQALPFYREFVEHPGDTPETLRILSQLLFHLGYVREARDLMEEAADAHPESIAIRSALARLYERAGYYTLARKTLEQLQQDFPDKSKPYVALAHFHMREGHLEEGETVLKKALRKGLEDLGLYQTLFEIEHRRKNHQAALQYLKSAVDLSPDDPERLLLLGDYFLFLKKYPQARKTYHRIAQTEPKSNRIKGRISQLLIVQGRYDEALEQIESLIADSPHNAEPHLLRGILWLRQGKTDLAKTAFLKVRTLAPESVEGHYFYGLTLLKEREYELALPHITLAVEKRPNSIRGHMALAYIYFKTGQLQFALEELGQILLAQPHHLKALNLRARVHLRLKNYEAAAADYRRMMEHDQSSPAIHMGLAETYRLQGRLDNALTEFEQAFISHPDSLTALKKIISIYVGKQEYEKAIDLCNSYLKRSPKNLEVSLTKAAILNKQKKYTRAKNVLKALSVEYPESDRPLIMLARMQMRLQEYKSALDNYQKAVHRNPKQIKARMEMAEIYETQEDLNRAIKAYEAVLRMDGSYGPAVNNLAYLYANQRQDLDHALSLAKKAYALLPDSPEAKDTLGWAYLKKGALFLAKKYLDEAVQDRPQNALFRFHLGVAFYRAKDVSEAREAFEKAIQSGLQGKEAALAGKLLNQLNNVET